MATRRWWTGLAVFVLAACGDGGGERTTALPAGACTLAATCAADEYCDFVDESCGVALDGETAPVGTCEPHCRDGGCICTQVSNPVCGCNDRTYPSRCEAESAGVSVAYDGACRCGTGPPCPGGTVCCDPLHGLCAPSGAACALGGGG